MTFDATEFLKISLMIVGFALSAVFGAIKYNQLNKTFRTVVIGLLGACVSYVVIATCAIQHRIPQMRDTSVENAVKAYMLTTAKKNRLAYDVYQKFGVNKSTKILADILERKVSVTEADGYELWRKLVSNANDSVKIINQMTYGWDSFYNSNAIQSKVIEEGVPIERINVYVHDEHRTQLQGVASDQLKNIPGILLREASHQNLISDNAFTRVLDFQQKYGSISFLLVDGTYLAIYYLTERHDKRFEITGALFTTDEETTNFAKEVFEAVRKLSTEIHGS